METNQISYKVGVKTLGDSQWGYNMLRFRTREQAESYGQDLANRWFAVSEWTVHESDDPVYPEDTNGN